MSGIVGIVGYALILVAFTIERVSHIVSLRQISIVFAVMMGSHFLSLQIEKVFNKQDIL